MTAQCSKGGSETQMQQEDTGADSYLMRAGQSLIFLSQVSCGSMYLKEQGNMSKFTTPLAIKDNINFKIT
jgi:hypothetical protein